MQPARHLPTLDTPPAGWCGGWCYRMPETGQDFGPYPDTGSLLDALRASYRANGYTAPFDLLARVEAYACAQVPDQCTGSEPAAPTLGALGHITYHMVAHGTKRLLGIDERVSAEQAERRAAVCVTCTENVPRTDCTNCNLQTLRDLVNKIVGGRKTPHDESLHVCRACLCELKSKVWLPLARLEAMSTVAEREHLPAHCWMRTEAAQ